MVALAGCQGVDALVKHEQELPSKVVKKMKAYGMTEGSPIMMRIFKEESELEVWKRQGTGSYKLVKSYDICKWSGKLGPKIKEGDRQAPEGFYNITPAQMNPNSSYYLSFNLGFPNKFDQANERTGTYLMVHGDCKSAGCYAMTDEQVAEIYAFARESFRGGQQAIQLQALPFRMTANNMARHRQNPHYDFWKMLKVGYDHFEITRQPPRIDVCNRRYTVNRISADGEAFDPLAACPPTQTPPQIEAAYQSYVGDYTIAYAKALKKMGIEQPLGAVQSEISTPLAATALIADPANSENVSGAAPGQTAMPTPVDSSAPAASLPIPIPAAPAPLPMTYDTSG